MLAQASHSGAMLVPGSCSDAMLVPGSCSDAMLVPGECRVDARRLRAGAAFTRQPRATTLVLMDTTFFGPAASLSRSDDLLCDYRAWLEARNGPGFVAREARMRERFDAGAASPTLAVDAARVNRNYVRFRERDVTAEELALLAFAKINAGEAWGVEQVARARAQERQRDARPGLAAEIEPLVVGEEHFHTRLLVGAAGHFHGADGTRLAMTGAWRPPAPLRLLIGGLVVAPRTLFHPLLLASEVGGVLAFDWLLGRLRTLFPKAPAIRESMEARLVEVLVDEVGHITFNRLLVGRAGRALARLITPRVVWLQRLMTPELVALGLDRSVVARLDRFSLASLPREVRARAFYA
jgi:hypothetical protein